MNTLENNRLADYRTFCDLVNIISAKRHFPKTSINYASHKHTSLLHSPVQVIINNLNGLVNIIKESPCVKVYPSQIVDYATIELKSTALFPVKAEVHEISGKIIIKTIFANENEMKLDLSKLCPGLYEIEIMDALKTIGEIKFIKYHLA
jgi:hypothetical protein